MLKTPTGKVPADNAVLETAFLRLISETFSRYLEPMYPLWDSRQWQEAVDAVLMESYCEGRPSGEAHAAAMHRVRQLTAGMTPSKPTSKMQDRSAFLSDLQVLHETLLQESLQHPDMDNTRMSALYTDIFRYLSTHYLRHLFPASEEQRDSVECRDSLAEEAFHAWMSCHRTPGEWMSVLDPLLEMKLFLVDYMAQHPASRKTMDKYARTLYTGCSFENWSPTEKEMRLIELTFSFHWDRYLYELQDQLRLAPAQFGSGEAKWLMQVATDLYENMKRYDCCRQNTKRASASKSDMRPHIVKDEEEKNNNLPDHVSEFMPGALKEEDIQLAMNALKLGPEAGSLTELSCRADLLWLHFRHVLLPHEYIGTHIDNALRDRRKKQREINGGYTTRHAQKLHLDTAYLQDRSADRVDDIVTALDGERQFRQRPDGTRNGETSSPTPSGQAKRLHALSAKWQAEKTKASAETTTDRGSSEAIQDSLQRMSHLMTFLHAHADEVDGNILAASLLHLDLLSGQEPKYAVLTRYLACLAMEDTKVASADSTRKFYKDQFIALQSLLLDWQVIDTFMPLLVRCLHGNVTQRMLLAHLQLHEPEMRMDKESTLSKRLSKQRTQVRLLLCGEHHHLMTEMLSTSHFSPDHRARYLATLVHWEEWVEKKRVRKTEKEGMPCDFRLDLDGLLMTWLAMEALLNGLQMEEEVWLSMLEDLERRNCPQQVLDLMCLYLPSLSKMRNQQALHRKTVARADSRALSLLPEGRLPESELLHLFSGSKKEYATKMTSLRTAVDTCAERQ